MDPATQAAAQVVHVAALAVVLNVDPATHAIHPVFARAVQVLLLRVPAAQTVQAVHTLFVVTVQADD